MRLRNTLIEGLSAAGSELQMNYGCLDLQAGRAILENVTLVRCSQRSAPMASSYLRVGASATLAAAFLSIVPNCFMPHDQPIIEAHGSSANRPLALRALRISTDESCSLPPASLLLANGTSIAACAQLPSTNGGNCGLAATCTDVALRAWGGSAFSSAECSCTGSTIARATASASAELSPYSFGCFTPRKAQSVSALGVTTSTVSFRLTKSATADATEMRSLLISMAGTDAASARWRVGSVPPWLSLEYTKGHINQTETSAVFQMTASTAMQPGREAPHEATLNISVLSSENEVFAVPVLLYVEAETVHAVWGATGKNTSCSSVTPSTTSVIAGRPTSIPFVGCDRDFLKNARRLPSATDARSFIVTASRQGAPDLTLPVAYDEVTGDFATHLNLPNIGEYTLRLRLGGTLIASPLTVLARGCPDGNVPSLGNANELCQPCEGVFWAYSGDIMCHRW